MTTAAAVALSPLKPKHNDGDGDDSSGSNGSASIRSQRKNTYKLMGWSYNDGQLGISITRLTLQ